MEFAGDYFIPLPRTEVWAALNDLAVLKELVPGCESLAWRSPTEIDAEVVAKVGPLKATFRGVFTLSDLDPPNGYVIRGEGQGRIAGAAKGEARVRLEETAGGTTLHYTVAAAVGGKLAKIGSRLVDSTAHKLADGFFAAFSRLAVARTAALSS